MTFQHCPTSTMVLGCGGPGTGTQETFDLPPAAFLSSAYLSSVPALPCASSLPTAALQESYGLMEGLPAGRPP